MSVSHLLGRHRQDTWQQLSQQDPISYVLNVLSKQMTQINLWYPWRHSSTHSHLFGCKQLMFRKKLSDQSQLLRCPMHCHSHRHRVLSCKIRRLIKDVTRYNVRRKKHWRGVRNLPWTRKRWQTISVCRGLGRKEEAESNKLTIMEWDKAGRQGSRRVLLAVSLWLEGRKRRDGDDDLLN